MTPRKKTWLCILSTSGLICLIFGVFAYQWLFGVDENQKGLKEGVSLAAASDSPIPLPKGAADIYYAYDLHWQGGCLITRYRLHEGDLKKQAEKHLKAAVPWQSINASTPATVPEHRFAGHSWFQPATIKDGFESLSSGILWEPKVWIDEVERVIYVIDQN